MICEHYSNKFAFHTFFRYFWLYKISYMWYAPLGFVISAFGGWLISVTLDYFGLAGESTIYTDENKTLINADLFTPPLAKRIRVRNAEILERNFAVIKMIFNLTFWHDKKMINFFAGHKW